MNQCVMMKYVPQRYMTQPFYRYCGIFQIATVFESRFWAHINPKKIFTWFVKFTWFCTPKQIVNKFNDLWLKASLVHKNHMTLDTIKDCLKNNQNIILLTWHGYNKRGDTFYQLKAFFAQHYISIWGYDADRKWFFVYDSSVKQHNANKDLPVGNIFLSERIVKRALSRAWWWFMSRVGIIV